MESLKRLIDNAMRVCTTRAELARRLGVTRQRLNEWERGARPVPTATLAAIAHIAGADVTTALGTYALDWERHRKACASAVRAGRGCGADAGTAEGSTVEGMDRRTPRLQRFPHSAQSKGAPGRGPRRSLTSRGTGPRDPCARPDRRTRRNTSTTPLEGASGAGRVSRQRTREQDRAGALACRGPRRSREYARHAIEVRATDAARTLATRGARAEARAANA